MPDPVQSVAAGGVLRPKYAVLQQETLVPATNVVRPPPNRFTHEVAADEPYYFDRPQLGPDPDGQLPAGTRVVLMVEDGGRCRVVSASGLYVEVRRNSLRELPGHPA